MVEAVSATILSQPMFNLTVDTAHTFFVGEGQWLVHNTECFPVLFEAELKKGVDYPKSPMTPSEKVQLRQAHNREGNKQLHEALQSDATFRKFMDENHPDIVQFVQPGRNGAYNRNSPDGWIWHHVPDQEGIMWLISEADHRSFTKQIHRQPKNRGGFEIWGIS